MHKLYLSLRKKYFVISKMFKMPVTNKPAAWTILTIPIHHSRLKKRVKIISSARFMEATEQFMAEKIEA
jgi:predicted transcriptional regulator